MPQAETVVKRIRIQQIIAETKEAKTFTVAWLDGPAPEYEAGQFITLVFFTGHGEKRRSYSLSSSPALNEACRFTVKKIENGEFSRLLNDQAIIGDILFSSGINGLFLLPQQPWKLKQFFFLAAGSGITPCFSMIKTILSTSTNEVVLIYSNRNETDAIFGEALTLLQQNYPSRLRIKFLFSDKLDIYNSRLSKWLLQQLLDEHLSVSPNDALFYLCGPFEYMRMITISLLGRIPEKNIFKENFNSLPRLLIPKPPDTEAHPVTIRINKMAYKLNVRYPESILKAARANGIELPYSCEAGRCGSCVANCIRGKTWMAYNEVLTDDEVEKGRVLLCQAFPVEGEVEIAF